MGNRFCTTARIPKCGSSHDAFEDRTTDEGIPYSATRAGRRNLHERRSSKLDDMPEKPLLDQRTKAIILTQFATIDIVDPIPNLADEEEPLSQTPSVDLEEAEAREEPPERTISRREAYPFILPDEETREITNEENKILTRLRQELGSEVDILFGDVLLRYTRAYAHEEQNRYEVTITRLRDFIRLKREYDFETLPRNLPSYTKAYSSVWPMFVYGRDKYGLPVCYNEVCAQPLKKVRKVIIGRKLTEETLEKLRVFMYAFLSTLAEYKDGLRREHGIMIYQHVQIMDVSQMGMAHIMQSDIRSLIRVMIGEMENVGTECLRKMYFINAPWVFQKIVDACRPFVDPLTVEKIGVFGTDYLDELKKEIPIDQIPREYGGTGKWEKVTFGVVDTESR